MSKIFFILILIHFSLSFPSCKVGVNNCSKCNSLTNLCVKCNKEIYTPDNEGGCTYSQKCKLGENYCNQCNIENNFCEICETGYFSDKNGGCSYTDNCKISYKGECIECDDDFLLIGNKLKFCKYKNSEDIRYCAEYDTQNGKCNKCEVGYVLTSNDKKCVKTSYCNEASFGRCTLCYYGYYLNKIDHNCYTQTDNLFRCKTSLDGRYCEKCEDFYYFSGNHVCVSTNFCSNAENGYCKICENGYYLTQFSNVCTSSKNCYYADIDTGICSGCENTFYLDGRDSQCKSNQEDNDYKFCAETDKNGKCIKCDYNNYLGEDKKCSYTDNCQNSLYGVCQKCIQDYYLGNDKKCTNVQYCIFSNDFGVCLECEDGYYFSKPQNKCLKSDDKFQNCKSTDYKGENCNECKDNYYLNIKNNNCYSNKENNKYYKCLKTDSTGEKCNYCVTDYYLGSEDYLCSKIEDCAIIENENRCAKCDEYYCLDAKIGNCVDNYYDPEDKDKMIYFDCLKTNKDATACEECIEDFTIINGLCINKNRCAEEKNGECVKCNELSEDGYTMCLNPYFECVESFASNCLLCDEGIDFDKCTKCEDGYQLDDDNDCAPV